MSVVAHFPSTRALSANPYWLTLRDGLAAEGVLEFESDHPFGRHWLLRNFRKVDFLHFHYVQQFYAYEGTHARLRWVLRLATNLVLARLLGYKTVFTLHNAAPTYPLQPHWVDHLGHWAAANLTSSVIVHCEAARQLLRGEFGRHHHVYTVPHPSFLGQYPNTVTRTAARDTLSIAPPNLVFGFLGGIRPNKGVEKLIVAFRRLEEKDLNLLIAGRPGPPKTYIEELDRSSKEDPRIILHKRFIPDDELQVYLNALDVVVLPFERILTSGSAHLAMGFARPLVVPAMGCLPELITKDVGILYDPSAPAGLLEALKHCQEIRASLPEMGRRAQEKVSGYTGELMAEQTMRAYGISS